MSEKEIDVVDNDLETLPESSGVISAPKTAIDEQIQLAENIDRLITAQNKIRMALLKLAQPGDWTIFSGDGGSKAEIGFAGSNRIGSTLGVDFTKFATAKTTGSDSLGDWYMWEVECDATYKGRTVRVYGRAGSRDKFFGKEHGKFKDLAYVNEGDIKMAARRGAMKEGIKVLFGLHHMDPEFLKTNGIPLASAGGHDFKSTANTKSAAAVNSMVSEIKDVEVIKEGTSKKGAWTLYAIVTPAGDKLKTFNEAFAKTAAGFRNFKTKALMTFETNQYGDKELTAISAVEEPKADAAK